jgi:heme/copper-type cytochrome/quinol oxidase subunit 1
MIGARDLAFPRLNAFGFWLTLFSGLLLYLSYLSERLGRRHFWLLVGGFNLTFVTLHAAMPGWLCD